MTDAVTPQKAHWASLISSAKAAVIIGWINIGFYLFFGLIWLLIVVVALLGSSA